MTKLHITSVAVLAFEVDSSGSQDAVRGGREPVSPTELRLQLLPCVPSSGQSIFFAPAFFCVFLVKSRGLCKKYERRGT